jgi:hypothetical protein
MMLSMLTLQEITKSCENWWIVQYFRDNPDSQNVLYNSKLGIYKEGCGLDNVMMSWGHDEYMYQVII